MSAIYPAIRPAIGPAVRGAFDGGFQPSGFNPRALFAASEPGAWYDPSDMSTLWQDSAGTVPVTAVEQPVGLMLDKRLGLALGPEQVVNGTFTASGTGWANPDTAPSVTTFTGGVATMVAAPGTALARLRQSLTLPAGTYEVSVRVVSVSGTPSAALAVGNASSGDITYATFSLYSAGVYTRKVTITGPTLGLAFTAASAAGGTIVIDDVSVKLLPGNHAYQTTTTSRPTLSARYNLLTATEDFTQSVWSKSNVTVTVTGDQPPFAGLGVTKFMPTAVSGTHYFYRTTGITSGQLTYSIYIKAAGYSRGQFYLNDATAGACAVSFDLSTGDKTITAAAGWSGVSAKLTPIVSGWWRVSISGSVSAAANIGVAFMAVNNSGAFIFAGDGVSGVLLCAADLRYSNDGVGLPEYQRVVDANTYDTAGFPPYLKFDGVDDWLQTANIDFNGTDKVLLSTAMRKFSDASPAVLIELSSVYTNVGAFALIAPVSAASTTVTFVSKGATTSITVTDASAVAPGSFVSTGYSDIGNTLARLRTNGVVKGSSTVDQGGGSYGNYPLYIGRRGGLSLPFNGRLYGLLIRGAATPDATIATVERYLNSKARIY